VHSPFQGLGFYYNPIGVNKLSASALFTTLPAEEIIYLLLKILLL
tara:strand:- start:445 stop:579 length:135 start_codon:yes stop_codon:yes gene_type:complete